MTDQRYLLEDQYRDSRNLQDRAQLHARFSVNPRGWLPWVFDRFAFGKEARLLDLGCGPGDLWYVNRARIPSGWEITLADLSPGSSTPPPHGLARNGSPIASPMPRICPSTTIGSTEW